MTKQQILDRKIPPTYSNGRALYYINGRPETICFCRPYEPKKGCPFCHPQTVYERVSGEIHPDNQPLIHGS